VCKLQEKAYLELEQMMAEKAKAEQALNEEEHELAEGRGTGRMLHAHHSIKF
jgi:hypothetical protein